MSLRSVIIATGSYLPQRCVSNDELSKTVDTNDAWIRERTGITQRHIVAEGEFTSHMAAKAAQAALSKAGLMPKDIDGIVVGTSTPDTTMPSVASKVQAMLGMGDAAALDVAAACTGFVYALSVAHGWLMTGQATRVLVIGAETMSNIVDWNDRGTCVLFGDGAGAVILEAQEIPSPVGGGLGWGLPSSDAANAAPLPASPLRREGIPRGIRAISLHAQGEFGDLLGTNGGVASTKTAGHLFMHGQEIFRHGVEKMTEATLATVAKAGLSMRDVDLLVGHQANARMLKMIGRSLKLPEAKCMVTVDKHANTSAASIPLALDAAVAQGKLVQGKIVAMPALGAGLTWGCAVICW